MSANTGRPRLAFPRQDGRATHNATRIGTHFTFSPQRVKGVEVKPEPAISTTAALTPPTLLYDQACPTSMPYTDTPCGAEYAGCGNWDPSSSGFANPAVITKGSSDSGSDLDTRLKDFPSSPPVVGVDLDDGECHSSHGVPLIISVPLPEPENTTRYSVEAWLKGVPESSPVADAGINYDPQSSWSGEDKQESSHHAPVIPHPCSREGAAISPLPESRHAPSGASSDKENVHPLSSPFGGPPPAFTPLPLSSSPPFATSSLCCIETPSRTKLPFIPSSASRFQPLRPPRGLFGIAPTRQNKHDTTAAMDDNDAVIGKPTRPVKIRIPSIPFPTRKFHGTSAFDIHEDPVDPVDVQLSPAVTCFRKGRGAKRAKARCASYYDTDIVGENTSPMSERGDLAKGKRKLGREKMVLGTHEESEELCTPKAFVTEAEGADFVYMVQGEVLRGL
ncbi:MAG: hypothetical protein LQ347_005804 [Umbilicaria vellea]|nr:MAG: hypothetical protein LQ347_005804 [Umbilicaria vellea]